MKRKAFTLIELAIALTVIGLMIGGSFQAVKAMREKTKVTEAKEQIKTVEDTLVRYALEFPNLPSIADFQNIVSPSIGNPKPLLYAPDAVLSLPSNDICAFSTTNLKVIDKDGVSIPNVAFVLAHGSMNNKLETTFNTSTTPHQVVVSQPSSAYDDIVQWVTLSELQQSVDCSYDKLVIINDYVLPRGTCTSLYTPTSIFADHGFPFADGTDSGVNADYEWCAENLPSWMSSSCNGLPYNDINCSSPTAVYRQCTSPSLQGIANPNAETYELNIFVKDKATINNTEAVKKSFTITIDLDINLVIINDYALPRGISTSSYPLTPIFADHGFPFTDSTDSDIDADYKWCIEDPSSTLSTWLNHNTCNGALSFEPDCSAISAVYNQCTSPNLQGGNPAVGVHRLNIFVKDKTKTVKKSFTITIDPDTSNLLPAGDSCTVNCQCQSNSCLSNVCQ